MQIKNNKIRNQQYSTYGIILDVTSLESVSDLLDGKQYKIPFLTVFSGDMYIKSYEQRKEKHINGGETKVVSASQGQSKN